VNVQRILVPVDGSRLAEAALPAACSLAQTLGARLLLLHVLERDAPAEIHGEPHLRDAAAAHQYLYELASRLHGEAFDIELHVHEPGVDEVATSVCHHANEHDADLIVMCAHGRTNLRERLIGRTAARIVRSGSVPVLLRTVRSDESSEFHLHKLLVPLELRGNVAPALDAARTLAAPYGASVTLLSVPEAGAAPGARLLPGTAALAQEIERADLERRLGELAEELRASVPEVDAVVADQRPTPAIVSLSAALPADLVIAVIDRDLPRARLFEPSTADELLARPELTLLVLKRQSAGEAPPRA
jgi:nucleotide-binding universal stress UspA family protein